MVVNYKWLFINPIFTNILHFSNLQRKRQTFQAALDLKQLLILIQSLITGIHHRRQPALS